jgi:hypothetical protein
MAKKWFIVMAIAIIALAMMACPADGGSSSGGGGGGNVLVVQNIPADVYAYGSSGGQIGIFPVGTTPAQALAQTGLVAGADLLTTPGVTAVPSGSNYTLTIPLYSGSTRWTGSGTYDIYVMLSGGGGHYYKVSSVSITSGTTTISFSSATPVTL